MEVYDEKPLLSVKAKQGKAPRLTVSASTGTLFAKKY